MIKWHSFDLVQRCQRRTRPLGLRPPPFLLTVQIASQSLTLWRKIDGTFFREKNCRCSTSKFGIGQTANSNCTPLGLHGVAEKIGGGWPVGTVFKSRQMTGFTWQGLASASITTRILWLEGLEPGFNRGGNVDSKSRYIYIHGTGDEPTLGRPASHGCIHLASSDLIPLYDRVPLQTWVWIEE